jgi:hypothetical protein
MIVFYSKTAFDYLQKLNSKTKQRVFGPNSGDTNLNFLLEMSKSCSRKQTWRKIEGPALAYLF